MPDAIAIVVLGVGIFGASIGIDVCLHVYTMVAVLTVYITYKEY
jgi:hypothetical protein